MNPAWPDQIYLASRSPRRRELLAQIGVVHTVLPFRGGPRADTEVDETPLPGEAPEAYVTRLARAKALHGERLLRWRGGAPAPVLAADTTLDLEGEIIGKPEDAEDAVQILARLSGKTHRVLTGVALASLPRQRDGAADPAEPAEPVVHTVLSVSRVRFRELTQAEIVRYVATGEPMDKAGAYGIQGRAGIFVAWIDGSYTGIMGLPVYETAQLLDQVSECRVASERL